MYLQKVIKQKNFYKNLFFVSILKVNDVNRRIRIRIHMDPRNQIRIHTKISWIRNTGLS